MSRWTSAWKRGDAPATGDAAEPAPDEQAHSSAAVLGDGERVGAGVLEVGLALLDLDGQGHPGLQAGQASADGSHRRWRALAVGDPRPAVIQFTPPGSICWTAPVESRCSSAPSNRYVTVASPMCGWGGTSAPSPGPRSSGPMRSAKMNGLDHAPLPDREQPVDLAGGACDSPGPWCDDPLDRHVRSSLRVRLAGKLLGSPPELAAAAAQSLAHLPIRGRLIWRFDTVGSVGFDAPMPGVVIGPDDPRADDVVTLLEQHHEFSLSCSPAEFVFAPTSRSWRSRASRSAVHARWRAAGGRCAVGARCRARRDQVDAPRERRGRGIGAAMLEHLLQLARERGYHRVSLETGSQLEYEPRE